MKELVTKNYLKPDHNTLNLIVIADTHQISDSQTSSEIIINSTVNECAEKVNLEPVIVARSRQIERGLKVEGKKIMGDLELLEGKLKPQI
jgi:hypothetical protein